MKIKTIRYARTFTHDYQSYRAEIEAELEDWETDLDASFDKLRDMVHDQIGRRSSDFTDEDRVQLAPLRSHVRHLKTKANHFRYEVQDLKGRLEDLRNYGARPVFESINDLLAVLQACGVSEDKFSSLLQARDNFSLALNSFDKKDEGNEDEDNQDEDNQDKDDIPY